MKDNEICEIFKKVSWIQSISRCSTLLHIIYFHNYKRSNLTYNENKHFREEENTFISTDIRFH